MLAPERDRTKAELQCLETSDLYELLTSEVARHKEKWTKEVSAISEHLRSIIQFGPIYYAEGTNIWEAAIDILEERDAPMSDIYDGLEKKSIECSFDDMLDLIEETPYYKEEQEKEVPTQELLADEFDMQMLAIKRETKG